MTQYDQRTPFDRHVIGGVLLALFALATGRGCGTSSADAENPRTAWGTLVADGKSVDLPYALAFQKDHAGVPTLAVFLSEQPVVPEQVRRLMRRDNEGLSGVWLKQPHVLFAADEQGKVVFLNCSGRHYYRVENMSATVRLDEGRVSGRARFKDSADPKSRSLSVKFDTPLIDWGRVDAICGELQRFGVSGSLVANDQEIKLTCASARDTTKNTSPNGTRVIYTIVLTEKDHSKLERPERNVLGGKYGCAVVVSCDMDGVIQEVEIRHPALANTRLKPTSQVRFKDWSFHPAGIEGQLTTGGAVETDGDTWSLNVKFATPEGIPEFAFE